VRESQSGRRVAVTGGVIVERHLGTVRIRRAEDAREPPDPAPTSNPASPHVYIDAREDGDDEHGGDAHGEGTLVWEGGAARVAWGSGPRRGYPHRARFPHGETRFPLLLRPWQPGDRAQMPYGRKKVKKLLLEARIPAHNRNRLVVLTDASGLVLWIPGVTEPAAPPAEGTGRTCCVEVSFDDDN